MIGAVLALLGGRGVALIGGALAAIALLFGVYQTGVNAERKRGEAASLRAQLAIKQADLDNARKAETDAIARAADLALAASTNEGLVDELEADLARRPVADRCSIDRADAERLRRIR